MFTRTKAKQGMESTKAEGSVNAVPSIVSSNLSILGDLQSVGEIQVDGSVEGDIRCQSLVVGLHGSLTGEIDVETLRIHGRITGQIRAKVVFLASTARVTGDIFHESLAIEPGAFVEGLCRRLEDNSSREVVKVPELKLAESVRPASVGGNNDDGTTRKSEDALIGIVGA